MLKSWFYGALFLALIHALGLIPWDGYIGFCELWTVICFVVAILKIINKAKRKRRTNKPKEIIREEWIPGQQIEDDETYLSEVHCSYRPILSKTEKVFFDELYRQCSKKGYYVFTKVRLEDLLEVNASNEFEREKQRSKIKSRHIDFVVCDETLHQIMGFELDDSSHNKDSAKKTDALKNEIFRQIGIPLYRISTNDDYWIVLERILKNY